MSFLVSSSLSYLLTWKIVLSQAKALTGSIDFGGIGLGEGGWENSAVGVTCGKLGEGCLLS